MKPAERLRKAIEDVKKGTKRTGSYIGSGTEKDPWRPDLPRGKYHTEDNGDGTYDYWEYE